MNKHNLPVSILLVVGILLTACSSAAQAASKAVPANWTATTDTSLPIPITFSFDPTWMSQDGVNSINIVNPGTPTLPPGQWWGPTIALVDGAMVIDPAVAEINVEPDQPVPADKTEFIPWPADFFAYLTALPGVEVVQKPENVTIGGIQGKQIIVMTPKIHPILWLKGDATWLGGEDSGVDPDFMRQIILLNVHGSHFLLEFDDDPILFPTHAPIVQEIFNSIKFGQ